MENIISKIYGVVQALLFLCFAIYVFLIITGRTRYTGEQEKIRKQAVEKYKWILIILMIVLFLSGFAMLVATLYKMMGSG